MSSVEPSAEAVELCALIAVVESEARAASVPHKQAVLQERIDACTRRGNEQNMIAMTLLLHFRLGFAIAPGQQPNPTVA